MTTHTWVVVGVGALLASIVFFVVLVTRIWQGRLTISRARFEHFRMYLAIFAAAYAAYCVWRFAEKIDIGKPIPPDFKYELIAYSIFWVLAPPIWFFVEYFAVANNCIVGFPGDDPNLKKIKDYADYASKVWAAVLGLLVALLASHGGKD
jgi:hypothetical protein